MPFNFLSSLVVAVVASSLYKSVDAFPSGAGGCTAGNNAVQGPHLYNPTTGSLADGGLSISLAGVTLTAGSTTTFPVSRDTVVTVTSTAKSFKGFLLRLGETGGVSTDTAWSFTGPDVQKARVCFDVGGVTHTSSSTKTSISAILNVPTPATAMPLDVTVVIANGIRNSEYYYSQYILTAAEGLAVATSAPVLPVTPSPVFPLVTPAPVFPVTPAPAVTVTSAPVMQAAPTAFPTADAPTAFPTDVAPTAFPTVRTSGLQATPTAFPTSAGPTAVPVPTKSVSVPLVTSAPVVAATSAPVMTVIMPAPVVAKTSSAPVKAPVASPVIIIAPPPVAAPVVETIPVSTGGMGDVGVGAKGMDKKKKDKKKKVKRMA